MEDEEALLRSVAMQNAQTILSARQRVEQELRRMKDALEDQTRVLELLNQTGTAFASKLDLESLVQAVTDAGAQISGAQIGAFFYTVRDASGGPFMQYALSGASREDFEKFVRPRLTALFAATLNGEGVSRMGNVQEDARYAEVPPKYGIEQGDLRVSSYLSVPVGLRSGEVVGGLFFFHVNRDVFSERTERILVGIAAQAAVSIDNARLYEEAKRAAAAERSARSEVERVSLMKDEFLATLSHELRTPLNAVLGWAEVLLARGSNDSETRQGLETIARNAHAQAQLIEDLLDMNRIVCGKIRLDVQRVDLASIIEAAVDSVRPSSDAKSIALRKILDPSAGPVFGDPHRIQQVVWNLLTNAVKFTPKGGKIDILLRRVNSHVEITVTDTGSGISAEFLPHVFERFRQGDSSTTRRHGGLGLGLSIVKQLVELHGGSARAESAGEHEGSTFVVSLPLRAIREAESREHPTARTQATRQAEIRLSGIKVLVVDDDRDARELVKFVLLESQAEVITARSAEEGLALLKSTRPDIVVSDIGMPESDGYELLRCIRNLTPAEGGRTPAIALTAFARSEDRTRALLAGYQVHIAKPIDPHELVVTIGSLTGRAGT